MIMIALRGNSSIVAQYLRKLSYEWLHWGGIALPVTGILYASPMPDMYKLVLGTALLSGLLLIEASQKFAQGLRLKQAAAQGATNLALPLAEATKIALPQAAATLAEATKIALPQAAATLAEATKIALPQAAANLTLGIPQAAANLTSGGIVVSSIVGIFVLCKAYLDQREIRRNPNIM